MVNFAKSEDGASIRPHKNGMYWCLEVEIQKKVWYEYRRVILSVRGYCGMTGQSSANDGDVVAAIAAIHQIKNLGLSELSPDVRKPSGLVLQVGTKRSDILRAPVMVDTSDPVGA